MDLYSIQKDGVLIPIEENRFKLERELQTLTEKNLSQLFGLEFVKSEFSIKDSRIDTLAFDRESNSFVIIEYKREKSSSVVDQGLSYLGLMLKNKADFVLEYNEQKNKSLKRGDIDWSQSRVVFIASSFTKFQLEAVNFKDLPIELCSIKRFANHTIAYELYKKTNSGDSIKTISKADKKIQTIVSETKVYTEEEHLEGLDVKILSLYEQLRDRVLQNFDGVEIVPRKLYIAFNLKKQLFSLRLQKQNIKIWLNLKKGELDDPRGLTKDVSQIGHWGNGDFELSVKDDKDFMYIISLIEDVKNKLGV